MEDSLLPLDLTGHEYQEASRALKSLILREELYADDGTSLSSIPFRVNENNYSIHLKQHTQPNLLAHYAVFLVNSQESMTVSHEREIQDPHVNQTIHLESDAYGNVLKSVVISYGRNPSGALVGISEMSQGEIRGVQEKLQVIYTDNKYTNAIDDVDAYRNPQLYATSEYEITGLPGTDTSRRFRLADFTVNGSNIFAQAREINYEEEQEGAASSVLLKRLVESSFKVFRSDDLGSSLPQGVLENLALPGESFRLALTQGLINKIYRRSSPQGDVPLDLDISEQLLENGGYVLLDGNLWIPSGTIGYSSSSAPQPAEARDHFFTHKSFRDKFGETFVEYDGYDLPPVQSTDAVGNTTTTFNSYVHLQPERMTDANGEIVGTAVMGKQGESVPVGDSLVRLRWSISEAQMVAFLANPKEEMADLLGDASTRTILIPHYSPTTSTPSAKAIISRETHAANKINPRKLLVRFTYFDGLDRQIQLIEHANDEKWRVSGWTVRNNKDLVVREYEPFLSSTHMYQKDAKHGVSATTSFYDPLGRPVGSLSGDYTWTKVVYGSWQTTRYDASDNIMQRDPRNNPHIGISFKELWGDGPAPHTWYSSRTEVLTADPWEREAAVKAAEHNDTPTVTHLDSLGRHFVTVHHHVCKGVNEFYANKNIFDIKGNVRGVIDAQQREAIRTAFDMCGNVLHHSTMDFGEEWLINDIFNNIILRWQDDNIRIRTVYDALRRPVQRFTRNPEGRTRRK